MLVDVCGCWWSLWTNKHNWVQPGSLFRDSIVFGWTNGGMIFETKHSHNGYVWGHNVITGKEHTLRLYLQAWSLNKYVDMNPHIREKKIGTMRPSKEHVCLWNLYSALPTWFLFIKVVWDRWTKLEPTNTHHPASCRGFQFQCRTQIYVHIGRFPKSWE